MIASVRSTLSREEQAAARIGFDDARRHCDCEPAVPREELGRASRMILWLIGDNRLRGLANPRLEAVRRFACATCAGHAPSVALMGQLNMMGLQPSHIAAVQGLLV
jgi:hypothetical protein